MRLFKKIFALSLAILAFALFAIPKTGNISAVQNCWDTQGNFTIPPETRFNDSATSTNFVCDPTKNTPSSGYWVPDPFPPGWTPPTPTKPTFDGTGCRNIFGDWIIAPDTIISDSAGNQFQCGMLGHIDSSANGGWIGITEAVSATCKNFTDCLSGIVSTQSLKYKNPGGLVGTVMGDILPIAIGLGGFLSVIIILISAAQFVLSNGDPESAAKARGRLIFALVGFALLVLAFAITKVIDAYFLKSGVV